MLSVISDGNHYDFRAMARTIESLGIEDPIIYSSDHGLLDYYLDDRFPVMSENVDEVGLFAEGLPKTLIERAIAQANEQARDLLLVSRQDRRLLPMEDQAWLNDRLAVLRTVEYARYDHRRHQLVLYHYRPMIPLHGFWTMKSTRIDGHVHYHPMFSLATFLRAACRNVQGDLGVLLLAQPDGAGPFELLESRLRELGSQWQCAQVEPTAFVLQCNQHTIVLVAGRQIVTRENLEVLALCTNEQISPGQPVGDTIREVLQQDAVPVLPWGFGKWWFSRGRTVRQLIRAGRHDVLLGDSGCRPDLGSSTILKDGQSQGIRILAGTDPLPMKSHETRAGSFCSVVPSAVDLEHPTPWVRQQLRRPTGWTNCGVRRNLPELIQDQIRLRAGATR